VKITPATFGDLVFVVDHLSEQNAAEQALLGNTKWHTLKVARGWLDDAVTAWWEGEPGFIFGIHQPYQLSWFLGTQAYFDGGAKAVRAGRQFVKQMKTIHGGFASVSNSPHPDAERWFRLIGLRQGGPRDGAKVYWCGSTALSDLAKVRTSER
jgi:hypothetical protein